MIPPLEENGYLPPGIHLARLAEIEARFGAESELRRAEVESLRWLVRFVKRAGIERLVIDGSFVGDLMSIESTRQLENTRRKLRMLEGRLEALDAEPPVNPHTRGLTKRSLKKLVNQLKEEIVRFETRVSAPSEGT